MIRLTATAILCAAALTVQAGISASEVVPSEVDQENLSLVMGNLIDSCADYENMAALAYDMSGRDIHPSKIYDEITDNSRDRTNQAVWDLISTSIMEVKRKHDFIDSTSYGHLKYSECMYYGVETYFENFR